MKVTLLKGIKYKKQSYKAGEEIEVESKDIAEMIEKQVIAADVEAQADDKPSRGKRKKDAEAEGDADTTPEG